MAGYKLLILICRYKFWVGVRVGLDWSGSKIEVIPERYSGGAGWIETTCY